MEKIVSFARKYYYLAVFTVFALCAAHALIYADLSGYDFLYKVKLEDGFFQTVAFSARELGDGIVGAFVRTALICMPEIVWKAVCVAGLIATDVLIAVTLSRGPIGFDAKGNVKEKSLALADSLAISSVMLCLIPFSVLGDKVLTIEGTVHFVIPAALVFALYLISDSFAGESRSLWYAPIVALITALLSWQAALAAIVIAVRRFVRAMRKGAFRPSLALSAAAPFAVFIAHIILWNVPRFPEGVAVRSAVSGFFGSVLGESGLFLALTALSVLVSARMMMEHIIPVLSAKKSPTLRFIIYSALGISGVFTAFVLILRSYLISGVTVSGTLSAAIVVVNFALLAAAYVFDLIDGKDEAPALFSLAALVTLAATLPTYTFGGGEYYLPLVLIYVVIGRELFAVSSYRPAIAILCGIVGCFAATLCLTKGKVIIAAGIVILVSAAELAPFFRRLRAAEALAVILALLTLWGVGSVYKNAAQIRYENSEHIEKFKADPMNIIILKKGDVSLTPGQLRWYKAYNGISDGVRVLFIGEGEVPSAEEVGDVNGDGKVNSRDTILFMKMIEE